MRFDNIMNERVSAQINYGVRHRGGLSSYLDNFGNLSIERELDLKSKKVKLQGKVDHIQECKSLMQLNVSSSDVKLATA